MKIQKLIYIAVFVVFCVGTYLLVDTYLISSAKPIDPLASGDTVKMKAALPFSMTDLEGHAVNPGQFKDKVLIVNFWASWCGPCVEEFPSLLKLVETYKNDVVLIAISGDDSEQAIRGFLKSYNLAGLPVHVTWDADRSVARLYGTNKLPESYIFDRQNLFYRKIEGIKNWTSPAFIKTFESLVHN